VFSGFLQPRHAPCPDCGESVAQSPPELHACDPERRLEYQVFQVREGLARLDHELDVFLNSPRGQFEVWYAERERRKRDV